MSLISWHQDHTANLKLKSKLWLLELLYSSLWYWLKFVFHNWQQNFCWQAIFWQCYIRKKNHSKVIKKSKIASSSPELICEYIWSYMYLSQKLLLQYTNTPMKIRHFLKNFPAEEKVLGYPSSAIISHLTNVYLVLHSLSIWPH